MLRISGADTLSFAHAQFSSDAQGLAIGKWHWSAWLTPKGRVTALFALYRPAENELLLILPDGEAVMMATQLQRYIFRRKVQIAVERNLITTATYDTPVHATGTQAAQLDGITELDVSGITLPRRLLLVPAAAMPPRVPAFRSAMARGRFTIGATTPGRKPARSMDTTADRPRRVECLQHTQRLLSRAGNRCTYSFPRQSETPRSATGHQYSCTARGNGQKRRGRHRPGGQRCRGSSTRSTSNRHRIR